MKILYAAGRRSNAHEQCKRILKNLDESITYKVAAFVNHNFTNADWNLNALLNFLYPQELSFEGENFEIYYNQIKSYNPNLIISDLELFTSCIGRELKIPVWHVSPSLLYFGLETYEISIKKYSSLFPGTKDTLYIQTLHAIENAEFNFIYSHFGDAGSFQLKNNFSWVRPYHVLGKESKFCKHNIVGVAHGSISKNFWQTLLKSDDAVLFALPNITEQFNNICKKSYEDIKEYGCNLKNCNYFIHQGLTDFCADAYYNEKFSHIIPNFMDPESIINCLVSEKLGLGKMQLIDQEIMIQKIKKVNYNKDIKYLHEKIEELR